MSRVEKEEGRDRRPRDQKAKRTSMAKVAYYIGGSSWWKCSDILLVF